MDLRSIAQALGGQVMPGGQVSFPPPGHSRTDRSGSFKFDPSAPDGFLINTLSPADDPLYVKDWVRDQLGWARETPKRATAERSPIPISRAPDPGEAGRIATALEIWRATLNPAGTPVEAYLARERRLPQPVGELAHAVRFHPACPFGTGTTPAMVCLVRDVRSNQPRAIHRTALTLEGRKGSVGGQDRLSLGPIGGGAIKLTPDAEVTTCLGVGEGMETALSLQLLPEFGRSPVWSLISAGGIAGLPVLAGIECLWIAVDHDEAGVRAAQTAAARWSEAGPEAFLVQPHAARADLNDVFKGRPHA
ncbi:toprim domain-containing protein [Methylobacterium ajmalii]|uniref:Toprim domain-containing protein n=1 Tax=Methylobacterium ajmalii TaxID=2738439 RepID=A0ABV0A6W9_9HYPH